MKTYLVKRIEGDLEKNILYYANSYGEVLRAYLTPFIDPTIGPPEVTDAVDVNLAIGDRLLIDEISLDDADELHLDEVRRVRV